MRSTWVPLSASALVIGAMAFVFGSVLNPADAGASSAEMLRVVGDDSARWLGMSVMYLLASFTLTLGLPAVMTLFERRGRVLGLAGVSVFCVGAIGTCGYAMLLVFFRALVVAGAVRGPGLTKVTDDPGLRVFLGGWIVGLFGGLLVLAIALFVARSTPRWVPLTMVVCVLLLPFSSQIGRIGGAVQFMLLAVSFTGIAMAAVTGEREPTVSRRPAF